MLNMQNKNKPVAENEAKGSETIWVKLLEKRLNVALL